MMQTIRRFPLRLSVGLLTLLAAGATRAAAGDWGARMGGDLGSAPMYAASSFFDADKKDFKYSSRAMEFGVLWKSVEVDFFLHTINKGYLNRGYAEKACPTIDGVQVCLPPPFTLPEGSQVDLAGLKLWGFKAGTFVNVWKPKKWLRFGIPVHVGLAFFSGQATQFTYRVELEPTDTGGYGYVSRATQTKIDGTKVFTSGFAGGNTPYPIGDIGIGVRVRSARWAEIELNLKIDNPRFPIFAWGMTFRRENKKK
jgi:hypothetical protein